MATTAPGIVLSNGAMMGPFWAGPRDFAARFLFLNGKARYEEVAGKNDALDYDSSEIRIYGSQRYEQLEYHREDAHPQNPFPYGSIWDSYKLPVDIADIDVALGIRFQKHEQDRWMLPRDIQEMECAFPDDDRVLGTLLEPVGSTAIIHLFTFSRKLGYALVSYQFALREDPNQPFFLLTNDQFRDAGGGFMLPFRIKWARLHWWPNKTSEVVISDTTTVKSYNVGDPKNTESLYTMVWPLRTIIVDVRTGLNYTIRDHKRTMTDAEIADLMRAADARKKADIEAAKQRINSVLGPGAATQLATQP